MLKNGLQRHGSVSYVLWACGNTGKCVMKYDDTFFLKVFYVWMGAACAYAVIGELTGLY